MYIRGREIKYNLVGGKAFSPPNLYWFGFSVALIVISVVALAVMGLNLGIEFRGGYLVKLRLDNPVDLGEVRGMLAEAGVAGLEKSILQAAEDNRVLILRMPYIEDSQVRKQTIDRLNQELDRAYGISEILQEEQVGSEWGREVSQKAVIALAVFLAVILVYITLRLEFKMAVTAIVALIHDTLITVGIYALTRRQVTPVTVIAFLTILGYSLYDTIVVFDRVEENTNLLARSGRMTFAGIVNESVNQTLMRSIGTTLTTLLPIITILVFGGETLKDFAFALFLGVLLGGYSSIFIASPLLAIWKEREPRYAAVRERVDLKGAREAILITMPAARSAGGAAPAADEAEIAAASETSGTRESERARKPATVKGGGGTPRKKPTTRGPSGGKKKKKKKR
ncbi:protein translocase subunit SecF [Candidatus Solincola tengchongensis]|uniref:protein translocase subunit SecF n=1 Tax=Candidatus Solincola tengchongensis TaxID=2900693 RepID=UPI00257DF1E7|nr:protein translocase subunit SecF [Candidatus Solincola tengchongensis]